MPYKNRLNLDFNLSSSAERNKLVQSILSAEPFLSKPPTERELNTLSDYILWGDRSTQKSLGLSLPTKWNDSASLKSYEELLESPTFNESEFVIGRPPVPTPHFNFDREAARKTATPTALNSLENLWRQIDETDLILYFYDQAHKQNELKPPTDKRREILSRFSELELEGLRVKASSLDTYRALKLKRELPDLRNTQYVLKDTYAAPILHRSPSTWSESSEPSFDESIDVRPLGVRKVIKPFNKIWTSCPQALTYTEEEFKAISKLLWRKPLSQQSYFDFRDKSHLFQLVQLERELKEELGELPIDSTLGEFLDTWEFYKSIAGLTKLEARVLKLKELHWTNEKILEDINPKFGKSYGANYISTIFHQKILEKLANAATFHRTLIENLCFPENFKTCTKCGRPLYATTDFFMRKTKSPDGLATQCKECARAKRLGKPIKEFNLEEFKKENGINE